MSYTIEKALNLEEVKSNQLIILDFTSLTKALKEVFNTFVLERLKAEKEINEESNSKEYLSISQVQEILKVSKVTIHNWKKRGLLKSHRIGRKVYFKIEDIQSAVKQQKYNF